MSSTEGCEEFLGTKRYPNVGVARKQSGVESDRELMEPNEEKKFKKASFKPSCTLSSIYRSLAREISANYSCKLLVTIPCKKSSETGLFPKTLIINSVSIPYKFVTFSVMLSI